MADPGIPNKLLMNPEQIQEVRKKWVMLGCRPRTDTVKRLEQEIVTLEQGIYEYQKGLLTRVRMVTEKKGEIAALLVTPSTETKEMEFDRLMECEDIENIIVDGNRIIVTTGQIDIEYRDTIYDIGKFVIYFAIDGGSGWLVRFKNLTREIGGHAHPHVETNGSPCLGNIKECMPHMLGSNQFGAAILVAIQYLKSYTYSEGGKPYVVINQWPKKVIEPIVMEIKAEEPEPSPPLPPPVTEEVLHEVSRSVDRTEGSTEEVREIVGEIVEQREDTGGGSTSRGPEGSVD